MTTGPTKFSADRCVTHHYACDCREWEAACVRERLEDAEELLQECSDEGHNLVTLADRTNRIAAFLAGHSGE